jgi:hypothetical protein
MSEIGLSRHFAALGNLVVTGHSGLWQAEHRLDLWVHGLASWQPQLGSSIVKSPMLEGAMMHDDEISLRVAWLERKMVRVLWLLISGTSMFGG